MRRPGRLLLALLVGASAIAWNPRFPPTTYRFDIGGGSVAWHPDGGTLGGLSNAEAVTLLDDAFGRWNAVAGASIDYTQGPQIVDGSATPVDVTAANYATIIELDNGQNPIIFDNDREIFDLLGFSSSVVGFSALLETSGTTIVKSMVMLQGDLIDGEPVGTPPSDPGEITPELFLAVAVHEAGHFGGLGHTTLNRDIAGIGGCPDPTTAHRATMDPLIVSEASSLHWDDEVGLSELYPAPGHSALPTIDGSLIDIDGVSAFDGGNVTLRLDTTDCDLIYEQAQAMQSGANPADYGGAGSYRFAGLTADTDYTLRASSITQSGSYPIGGSNPPALGGPDDSYNGASEDFFDPPDLPDDVEAVVSGTSGADIGINNSFSPGTLVDSLVVDKLDGSTGSDPQQLALDDGAGVSAFGLTGANQLAWINRFTPDPALFPFSLERLDIIFWHSSAPVGRAIRLVVYADESGSGDPANATLVHSEETTIQGPLSTSTFQEYTLSMPVTLTQGEFYIGVYDLVADEDTAFIAGFDVSTTVQRSYVQINGTDAGGFTPCESGRPVCSGDRTWLLRAYGRTLPVAGSVRLRWGDPCNAAQLPGQDYAVYEGTLGNVAGSTDLSPLACGGNTGQSMTLSQDDVPGSVYWLVTPLQATREGSLAPRAPIGTCATVGPEACE